MKKILYILYAISIIILASGCDKEERIGYIKSNLYPSLIEEYVEPEGIKYVSSDYTPQALHFASQLQVKGEAYTLLRNPERYAELQKECNDVWAKGVRLFTPKAFSFVPHRLNRISVTAVDDYNDTHPAGASLNDVFYFMVYDLEECLFNTDKSKAKEVILTPEIFKAGEAIGGKYIVNNIEFNFNDYPSG